MKVLQNGRSPLVDIDEEQLRYCLAMNPRTRNQNYSNISTSLGYAAGYISKCLRDAKMSEKAMQLLYSRYSVDPNTYKKSISIVDIQETRPNIDNNIVLKVSIDACQLEDMIKKAVREAFEQL